jgi:hypothetical protein
MRKKVICLSTNNLGTRKELRRNQKPRTIQRPPLPPTPAILSVRSLRVTEESRRETYIKEARETT